MRKGLANFVLSTYLASIVVPTPTQPRSLRRLWTRAMLALVTRYRILGAMRWMIALAWAGTSTMTLHRIYVTWKSVPSITHL